MKIQKSVIASKFNILIYAVPGVGKTVLAASAVEVPSLSPVIILDIDRGLRSVSHLSDKFSHAQITSTKEFEEALFELAGEKGKEFKTVVIDSVTELAAMEIETVAKAAVAKGGRRDNVDQIELIDYKLSGQKLLRLLRLARDLPQNVIFTAKALKVVPKTADGLEIPGAKPAEIFPAMPKKVREELAGMVDLVGFLNLESDESRKLYTQPLGPIVAKNRIAGIPAIITNPHMKDFLPQTKKESK